MPYGLLASFIDDLLDAARGRPVVVDGFELSYGFKEAAQFAAARQIVYGDVLPIVGAREAYQRRLRLAFGLWLDYDWRRRGWSSKETGQNWLTPSDLEASLRAASTLSDEYVWLYGETVRWWATPDENAGVPQAYVQAMRGAGFRTTSVRPTAARPPG